MTTATQNGRPARRNTVARNDWYARHRRLFDSRFGNVIAVERKSLSDLLSCVGTERERFEREVQRLLAYPCRALVVESTWPELEAGEWRSQIKPTAVIGSLLGWIAMGLPVIMATDHRRAGRYVSRLLYIAARRRLREARALVASIPGGKK